MNRPPESLLQAIEASYSEFNFGDHNYPVWSDKKPLRTAEPAELNAIAMHAITTNGSLDEYLYLFPRILEASALNQAGGFPGFSPLWIAQKLTLAKSVLTLGQESAVNAVFFEAFCWRLALSPDEACIDDWFHAIAYRDRDLERIFHVWLESSHPNSVRHLIELVSLLFQMNTAVGAAASEYFYALSRGQLLRVANWIAHSATIEKLRAYEIPISPHQEWESNRQKALIQGLSSQSGS